MKNPIPVLILAGLVVASAGAYAAERYAGVLSARQECRDLEQSLGKALALAEGHPRAFGSIAPANSAGGPLKALAQEAAVSRNITLAYLSESERDAEKGRRERQVLVRLQNAAHSNLVLYLQDLEVRGGGAVVREIHVRPSREIPDTYEDVEVVLSRTSVAPAEKKP